jgi:hypothetical protein
MPTAVSGDELNFYLSNDDGPHASAFQRLANRKQEDGTLVFRVR